MLEHVGSTRRAMATLDWMSSLSACSRYSQPQRDVAAVLAGRVATVSSRTHQHSLGGWPAALDVLQLKFDENFDDILDEGASSTHTPEQLAEWACS